MGADPSAIKGMRYFSSPTVAFDLVSRLKKELDIPFTMQCMRTTGIVDPPQLLKQRKLVLIMW